MDNCPVFRFHDQQKFCLAAPQLRFLLWHTKREGQQHGNSVSRRQPAKKKTSVNPRGSGQTLRLRAHAYQTASRRSSYRIRRFLKTYSTPHWTQIEVVRQYTETVRVFYRGVTKHRDTEHSNYTHTPLSALVFGCKTPETCV